MGIAAQPEAEPLLSPSRRADRAPLDGGTAYVYGDYLTWSDDVRWELIDGTARAMSPAPSVDHQEVVVGLAAQARSSLRSRIVGGKRCRAFVAPFDVRLPRAGEADEAIETVVQPDVLVTCDPSKLDRRGLRGAPTWIAEVLSPATARFDQIVKRELYERHGVGELWLVHPYDRIVTVYRRAADGSRFEPPEILATEGRLEVRAVEGLTIDWDQVFENLDDDPI